MYPKTLKLFWRFETHAGARFLRAGIGLQFHTSGPPRVQIQPAVAAEERAALVRGLEEGLSHRFPDFPATSGVTVTDLEIDPVHTSPLDLYRAGKLAIEQAWRYTMEITGSEHPADG